MQAKLESLEAIEQELAELSAQIESAKHRLVVLIEAFDRADGWSRQGFVSCAAFFSYRVGLGKVADREHVRVARALPELPVIAESMAAGELSFSKVRALTRVGGFKLVREAAGVCAFTAPDGHAIESRPPALSANDGPPTLRLRAAAPGRALDAWTMPLWQGDKMDLSWAWGLVKAGWEPALPAQGRDDRHHGTQQAASAQRAAARTARLGPAPPRPCSASALLRLSPAPSATLRASGPSSEEEAGDYAAGEEEATEDAASLDERPVLTPSSAVT